MVRQFTERDFGPTYGATPTLDVLRVWNIIQCPMPPTETCHKFAGISVRFFTWPNGLEKK